MSTEDDQARWRGFRLATGELFLPVRNFACTGTQIAKEGEAVNDTTEIHEVTAGKILHLNNVALSGEGGVKAIISLGVRNALNVLQYHLVVLQYRADTPAFGAIPFSICLKIAAGWDIIVTSDTALATAHAFIHGHELDA